MPRPFLIPPPASAALLAAVPDEPLNLYARHLVESRYALRRRAGRGWLLVDHDLATVAGLVSLAALRRAMHAVDFAGRLLLTERHRALVEALAAVSRQRSGILLRLAGSPTRPHRVPGATLRRLSMTQSLRHLPRRLADDIEHARRVTIVRAAHVDGLPVSFAYAGARTDRYADLSVDTLAAFRNRGLGALTARRLLDDIGRDGRTPIWGSYAGNAASLTLARKLGFTVEAGRLWVLTPRS